MFTLNQTLTLDEPWLEFKTLLVRQLAFCICSPNILAAIPPELTLKHHFQLHKHEIWRQHFQNYHSRLLYLDQHPQELIDFLHQLKSTRLGLRFEMLIWFWLLDQNYHCYQLIGHSIQKISGAKTLGELDFLLLNTETQKVEHWEVALKYYLAETHLNLGHWYGLNRSDTLFRKLNHFSQQQFQFDEALQHPIQQRYAVLKGQLFLPIHAALQPPYWVNQQRRLGYWGHQMPAKCENFYRLQRSEWICPEMMPTSQTAHWWTEGLYLQKELSLFYMFRNISPLYASFGR